MDDPDAPKISQKEQAIKGGDKSLKHYCEYMTRHDADIGMRTDLLEKVENAFRNWYEEKRQNAFEIWITEKDNTEIPSPQTGRNYHQLKEWLRLERNKVEFLLRGESDVSALEQVEGRSFETLRHCGGAERMSLAH